MKFNSKIWIYRIMMMSRILI